MKIKNKEIWDNYVEKNTDFYGRGIITFAQRWAELMETEMADGAQLHEVSKSTSSKADTKGITGFMYGAAVQVLSDVWVHGEELRKWHNKEYGDEDRDGVINPALITISVGKDE